MVQFFIDEKITTAYSTNTIYSGMHFVDRSNIKNMWKWIVVAAIRNQIPKRKIFDVPVVITFAFKSNLDIDNHSFIAKMIIDGLKGELIHNDSKKYVKGLVFEFLSKKSKHDIIVTVSELE